MKKAKFKIITGFRADQTFSVDEDEAHKAYWLFMNPDKRGIFRNGIAVVGSDIREIHPDWHGMMGWNPTHKMDSDDWNEINEKGVKHKFLRVQERAQDVARMVSPGNQNVLSLPLSEANTLLLN